ncbi:TPA: AAC(3) family N-acetyltransferase [Vibrio cholerae]
MLSIDKEKIVEQLIYLGINKGDTVLIRASLGKIGRINGGARVVVEALLEAVGPEGTIISLAFTSGAKFFKMPSKEDAFDISKKSYAGALPNTMISHELSHRSRHPMCSYVAIGRHAEFLTADHDETSPAYEPIRKLINLNGKCLLIGCVKDSPGFTTTHLAEFDLGLLKLNLFPKMNRVFYRGGSGELNLFRRSDPGLCSNSYYKFYSHYVREGILFTGKIGNAYSVIADASSAYKIDKQLLIKNKKFNICENKDCFTCNGGRWDRVHYLPFYLLRRILFFLINRLR